VVVVVTVVHSRGGYVSNTGSSSPSWETVKRAPKKKKRVNAHASGRVKKRSFSRKKTHKVKHRSPKVTVFREVKRQQQQKKKEQEEDEGEKKPERKEGGWHVREESR
jgi:hypothetical protein